MGGFEPAHTGAVRAGVCPLHMTEEFAFQQVFVQGRTIDLDVGFVAAPAGPVNRPRHQLLAAAALPLNHHRGVGGGHVFDHLEQVDHCRGFAQDTVIALVQMKCLAQVADLLLRADLFGDVGKRLDGTDNLALFIAQHRCALDNMHRMAVLVGNQALLFPDGAPVEKAAPLGTRPFSDDFASRAVQYSAGLPDQFIGRIPGNPLCCWIGCNNIPLRIHHHQAVLQCVHDGFPVFGDIHDASAQVLTLSGQHANLLT